MLTRKTQKTNHRALWEYSMRLVIKILVSSGDSAKYALLLSIPGSGFRVLGSLEQSFGWGLAAKCSL
jgi:hypothetical protein